MKRTSQPKPARRTRRPAKDAAAASHDTAPPDALLDFMVQGWEAPARKLPPPIEGAAHFHARRRALSKRFRGETLIIPTGHEQVRANDTYYRFRPNTEFYYLTGCVEPDGVLVMEPKAGGGHRDVLFVEPNPGKTDATFFTDRVKGELWVGARLGVDESRARFGMHAARGLPELKDTLKGLRTGKATRPHRVLRGVDAAVDGVVGAATDRDRELAVFLSELRLLKDDLELRELKRAIAATKRGFEDVIRALPEASSERHVEGVFNLRARVEGNDVGYNTIAGAGADACVLHWMRNDGKLRKRDLLLLDAGVEAKSLYTADITRTLPIGGRFSKPQREIYELVLAAQAAAFAEVRPGRDFMAPNRAAMQVLAEGLERLGILEDAAAALADEHQFYKRYTLHNVSHMLGLDVHDCAKARAQAYKLGDLTPGMVLTVEPGLYFQTDDLTVPKRYRGIGVRIEDDVVVTARGCRILSDAIPREAGDVEAWMASLWDAGR